VSADLVFLQEVLGDHRRHAQRVERWPAGPQYEFLADSIWPQFAYGRNAAFPGGHHGNAMLSKWPIVHQRNHDVSIQGPERRGLLHCRMRVPDAGTDLHAVCVHLGLRETHRERQLDLLCRLVEREVPADAPLIVAGDFNDWRLRAHDRLDGCAGLREVFVEHAGRAARTFPARLPMLPLDRIYVRNVSAIRPRELPRLPWRRLSDHAPLAAEVTL
jgi:endonuclease/exonuclease/phosphatase family metal-dependent hydrolase